MKKNVLKITLTTIAVFAILFLGFVILAPNLKGVADNNVTKNSSITSISKNENPTIAYFLSKYKSEGDFESWVDLMNSHGNKIGNDSFVIKDSANADDGVLILPAKDEGGAKIVDSTGKILKSYSRNDPEGATIAQIKSAFK